MSPTMEHVIKVLEKAAKEKGEASFADLKEEFPQLTKQIRGTYGAIKKRANLHGFQVNTEGNLIFLPATSSKQPQSEAKEAPKAKEEPSITEPLKGLYLIEARILVSANAAETAAREFRQMVRSAEDEGMTEHFTITDVKATAREAIADDLRPVKFELR